MKGCLHAEDENNPAQWHRWHQWVCGQLMVNDCVVTRLAGDAGHRDYYRVVATDQTYILMQDALIMEGQDAFYLIAKAWRSLGIPVPNIIARNEEAGLLLLSDFGDEWLLKRLHTASCDTLYRQALTALLPIHQCRDIDGYQWPIFDRDRYQEEFSWFVDWYLQQYLSIDIVDSDRCLLDNLEKCIANECLQQPQVLIHYDYQSRNLMCLPDQSVGVLDFQDARIGPVTYDIASLFNDCYIDWPREQVEKWCQYFLKELIDHDVISSVDRVQWMRWFDYVSMQRHLRNLGNFTRLSVRHKKEGYLQYFPRMQSYLLSICSRYSELMEVGDWLAQRFQAEKRLK